METDEHPLSIEQVYTAFCKLPKPLIKFFYIITLLCIHICLLATVIKSDWLPTYGNPITEIDYYLVEALFFSIYKVFKFFDEKNCPTEWEPVRVLVDDVRYRTSGLRFELGCLTATRSLIETLIHKLSYNSDRYK